MLNIPKVAIIIGGGESIKEGLSLGLKDRIKDKLVVTVNYAFMHFDSTFLCFRDPNFYFSTRLQDNPFIYNELKSLPLIVGMKTGALISTQLPNTILLNKAKENNNYWREKSLERGFVDKGNAGAWTLGIVSYLMNYEGIIYCLGFDWSHRPKKEMPGSTYTGKSKRNIHYYDDVSHYGIYLVSWYEKHNPEGAFKMFIEPKLKIYNVSPSSNIETFEKISYTTMFELLDNVRYNQDEIRQIVKESLCKSDNK